MKKLISVVLMAVMLFSFASCANVSKDSIQPAVYRMHESQRYPHLSLRDDGSFSIVYNSMSINSTKGTYKVEEKVLILTAEDGSVYCFDVKKDAIKFNADISDEFDTSVFEEGSEIVDGTKFFFWRAYENS